MEMRFQDKVALVTGGGGGIGRATCEIIGRDGGIACAVDTNVDGLNDCIATITGGGGRGKAYPCNVLDKSEVDSVVADVIETYGRIDILVNCVGGSTIVKNVTAGIDELGLDEWQALINFNMNGTYLFIHAVVPHMKAQGVGKIVNMSSFAAHGRSKASSAPYAAAKGGIISLTAKLAIDLGPDGINVNAIAPGMTLTERVRPLWEGRSEEQRQKELEHTALRRVSDATDQANVICFLASADADFVTGITINVDGGRF